MPITRTWMIRALTNALATVLMSNGVAWAEAGADARELRGRQAIEALLAERDAPVQVTLSNGVTRVGRVEPLGRHSFLLVDRTGQPTQVHYRQVFQAQRPSKKTIVIAALGAAAVVVLVCTSATGNPLCIPTGA
jgi:hypothetical protein